MNFRNYKYLILALFVSMLVSCNFFGKKSGQSDLEVIGLDLLPMYGSTAMYGSHKKTAEQREADRLFLMNSDQAQPLRMIACRDYIEFGWYYLQQGDTDMAMRRANHAWQLDSTNPDVYGLFAAILNAQKDHEGAIDMLERGMAIQPDHITLYDMYLSESIDIFRQTGDNTNIRKLVKLLDNLTVIDNIKRAEIEKIKTDARAYLK